MLQRYRDYKIEFVGKNQSLNPSINIEDELG